MSQLPVPYVHRALALRARRTWPIVAREAGEWAALFGIAMAALGTAAGIVVVLVNTWK